MPLLRFSYNLIFLLSAGSLQEGSCLTEGTEVSEFLDENVYTWQEELSFLKIKKPVLNFKPQYATLLAVREVKCLWLALSYCYLCQGFISYHCYLSFHGMRKSEVNSEEQECNPLACIEILRCRYSHMMLSHPIWQWKSTQTRRMTDQHMYSLNCHCYFNDNFFLVFCLFIFV